MALVESALKAHIVDSVQPLINVDRQAWLNTTASNLQEQFKRKYLIGQSTHKRDLGYVTISELLNEMEAEALDQLAYVAELKRRLLL